MPIQIAFDVQDDDLERFAVMARKVKAEMPANMDGSTLAALVRVKLNAARTSGETPQFVLDRIDQLEQLADMVEDAEWGLEGEDRDRVRSALFYFSEPNDLIPDRVPVFGFLDDAIMVELSLRDFEPELTAYRKFCGFRTAEMERRAVRGSSDEVTKEDWLADQRALHHHQMRERRRAAQGPDGGWRITLW
jgi:uncharacterized membrane protein YkvA (DUF1232 family)